jgi:competence protein ComEA
MGPVVLTQRQMWRLILVPFGAIVAALPLTAAAAQDSLPDKPGKETVVRVCSACHELDTAVGTRHTRTEWRAVVDAMLNRGAKASDEEIAAIIDYLATHVALVNVNKAPAAEIEAGLAIPPTHAEEIVRYRTEHGEFADLDGLKKVPGVDAAVLEERKDRITFR